MNQLRIRILKIDHYEKFRNSQEKQVALLSAYPLLSPYKDEDSCFS